jgi:hypothetical protein
MSKFPIIFVRKCNLRCTGKPITKVIFLIQFLLAWTVPSFATTSITSDTTWEVSNSPYVISDLVIVSPGVTLTIGVTQAVHMILLTIGLQEAGITLPGQATRSVTM